MGSNIGFSIYSNDRRFPFWTCLCKKVSAIKGNYRINNSAETMQIMAKTKAVAGVWEMLGQLIPKISSSGFFPWHFPSTIGVQFHPSMAYLYFGKNQTRGDLHWEEEQQRPQKEGLRKLPQYLRVWSPIGFSTIVQTRTVRRRCIYMICLKSFCRW